MKKKVITALLITMTLTLGGVLFRFQSFVPLVRWKT